MRSVKLIMGHHSLCGFTQFIVHLGDPHPTNIQRKKKFPLSPMAPCAPHRKSTHLTDRPALQSVRHLSILPPVLRPKHSMSTRYSRGGRGGKQGYRVTPMYPSHGQSLYLWVGGGKHNEVDLSCLCLGKPLGAAPSGFCSLTIRQEEGPASKRRQEWTQGVHGVGYKAAAS
jgi:hypothetical protein